MAKKWKDSRGNDVPPPKPPLSPEELRIVSERLARLDKFCEGMDSEAQFQLLDLAHRYTAGEITFEEFEAVAGSRKAYVKCSEANTEAKGSTIVPTSGRERSRRTSWIFRHH
jgi:hypothetical protein